MGIWDVSRRQEQTSLGSFRTQPHTWGRLCPSQTLRDIWTCRPPCWASTHTTHLYRLTACFPADGHNPVAPLLTPCGTPLHTPWHPLAHTQAAHRHADMHSWKVRSQWLPRSTASLPYSSPGQHPPLTTLMQELGDSPAQLFPLSQTSPSTDGKTQGQRKAAPCPVAPSRQRLGEPAPSPLGYTAAHSPGRHWAGEEGGWRPEVLRKPGLEA